MEQTSRKYVLTDSSVVMLNLFFQLYKHIKLDYPPLWNQMLRLYMCAYTWFRVRHAAIQRRHANGQGGDGFYIPRPHTLLTYTYPLLCAYPTGMRNRILSPSSTDLGIPTPNPSLAVDNFF